MQRGPVPGAGRRADEATGREAAVIVHDGGVGGAAVEIASRRAVEYVRRLAQDAIRSFVTPGFGRGEAGLKDPVRRRGGDAERDVALAGTGERAVRRVYVFDLSGNVLAE